MKIIRILASILIALTVISLCSGMALADSDAPPAIPDDPDAAPAPAPSGGGGGGGGYTAPSLQPRTEELKSSDGSVIGTLDIKDYFTVIVSAGSNTTVDNQTYSLALRSELGGKPEGAVMDIAMNNITAALPAGMNDTEVLASANVSRSARYGWSLKEGSATISFTMPATAVANQSNASQLFIVRYDGTGYQIMPASLTANTNGTVTLTAQASADFGLFTAVLASPAKPEPVPTPTPTPEPTIIPTATPEPTPEAPEGLALPGGLAGIVAIFVGGASIGAAAIFILGRFLH
ncbi:hypothetical protein [Methanocella sp. MCL-LM]|uniref:hypothetical protein n=1 Tax=Methanocella sp. MCL-LM TaxID=3412035 RepID=UPI003C70E1F0